jgi:hypothetical protein
MKPVRQSNKKIIAFFEPRCTGIVHLDSASSIIDMFAKIFPAHTLVFTRKRRMATLQNNGPLQNLNK